MRYENWTKRIKLADEIRDAILADVTDRRGWRQEWERFDDDIQEEIKNTWTGIISQKLKELK